MHYHTARKPIVYMLLFLLTGCTPLAARETNKTLVESLQDGQTTKEEVLLKLGPPSGTFEREKIISYRLGKTKQGYFVIEKESTPNKPMGPAWLTGVEGKFNLMLVFDEHAILQRHSLVPID